MRRVCACVCVCVGGVLLVLGRCCTNGWRQHSAEHGCFHAALLAIVVHPPRRLLAVARCDHSAELDSLSSQSNVSAQTV